MKTVTSQLRLRSRFQAAAASLLVVASLLSSVAFAAWPANSAEQQIEKQLNAKGKSLISPLPTYTVPPSTKVLTYKLASSTDVNNALKASITAPLNGFVVTASSIAQLVNAASGSGAVPPAFDKYVGDAIKTDSRSVSPVLLTNSDIVNVVDAALSNTDASNLVPIITAAVKVTKANVPALGVLAFTKYGAPSNTTQSELAAVLVKNDKEATWDFIRTVGVLTGASIVDIAEGAGAANKGELPLIAAAAASIKPGSVNSIISTVGAINAAKMANVTAAAQTAAAVAIGSDGEAANITVTALSGTYAGIPASKLIPEIITGGVSGKVNQANNIVAAAIGSSNDMAGKSADKVAAAGVVVANLISRANNDTGDAPAAVAAITAQAISAVRAKLEDQGADSKTIAANNKASEAMVAKVAGAVVKAVLGIDGRLDQAKVQELIQAGAPAYLGDDDSGVAGAATGAVSSVTKAGNANASSASTDKNGRMLYAVLVAALKAGKKNPDAILRAGATAAMWIAGDKGGAQENASFWNTSGGFVQSLKQAAVDSGAVFIASIDSILTTASGDVANGRKGAGAAGVSDYAYRNATGTPVTDIAGF